jgi:hypothetical protein
MLKFRGLNSAYSFRLSHPYGKPGLTAKNQRVSAISPVYPCIDTQASADKSHYNTLFLKMIEGFRPSTIYNAAVTV